MMIHRCLVVILLCLISRLAMAEEPTKPFPIPTIDLSDQVDRQVVVDREAGQYLGHVTTCLLEDGKTILCVYPKGHGRGAIVYKRSTDGGLTWSDRLPTPASWATSKEVPTLHRVIGPDGKKRIIMWSGLYPARLAVTEDDGATWGQLEPVGKWGGIVVMGFVEQLKTGKGHYLAMFHDDGRFFGDGAEKAADAPVGKRTDTMTLYKTFSKDGGLTWSFPEAVYQSSEVHLCEPGCIRSPDGKRLAVLLRENARRKNSHVIFSDDEGKTWSAPRELPLALTGDRHTGKYGPDGRLFISFRCNSPKSKQKDRPFEGDWVGWVGTWDDIVNRRDGQYEIRLKDNTKSYDTTYPGVEILPDGTFVTTTYGHWAEGESPYILSVRFKLDELDALAKQPRPVPVFELGDGTNSRFGYRIPSIVATNQGTLLAFAERRLGLGDHAENDIVLRRSEDNGISWGDLIVVHEEGAKSLNNPCAVVLPDTGRILLMYQRFPADRHSRAIGKHIKRAEPGITGDAVVTTWLQQSDDDGKTWSMPRDVTAGTKRAERIVSNATGPGVGIVLRHGEHRGRILMPHNETWYEAGGTRRVNVYASYSDDGGETWQLGDPAPYDKRYPGEGNEVQMVELSDGTVMLNSRTIHGSRVRKVGTSRDGGATWTPLVDELQLVEPQCMGSILRVNLPGQDGKTALVFSCPGSKKGRNSGTIYASFDDGRTWPVSRVLEPGGFAYSCMTQLADGCLGCLYEAKGYKQIVFARFSFDWLGGRHAGTRKETSAREKDSKAPIRVACVGDSITFGHGIKDRKHKSYPARLQELLGDRYQVGNFGLSGTGALKNARREGTLWPRHYAKHPPYRASIDFKPNVVVLNLGINDIVHWNELGDELVGDYSELIRSYQDLPTRPRVFVWHKLAPLFPGQKYYGDPNVAQLNAAIAEAAKATGVAMIDMSKPLAGHAEWFPDHIHPNAAGSAKIAEVVAGAIRTKPKRLPVHAPHPLPQAGEGPGETAPRPNVLLIVSEDNGSELGCYGDPFARTPQLDRLAAEGVRFQNAFVTYSVCSPSRGTIFTGLYPHQNGQIGLATHKYAMYCKWPNMVSLLKEHGYRTGIIGKIHVNPESAFPCDFRAFPGSNFGNRPVRKFADAAGQFMTESEEPFFLMVNYPDAHFPLLRQQYGLPEKPLDGKDVRPLPWVGADSPRLREFTANYYNCLERLDTGVGMLLNELEQSGKSDKTLVIYLGDHGAQFSRGKTGVYEAGLRIPLMVRHPGAMKAGTVREELVSTIDLLPTVLDAVGIDLPDNLAGKSLLPLVAGEDVPWRQYIHGVTTGAAPTLYYPQISIRDARYKLIVSPLRGRENACADKYLHQMNVHFAAGTTEAEIAQSPPYVREAYSRYMRPPPVELYDLKNDPYEWNNLAEDPKMVEVKRHLQNELSRWQRKMNDPLAEETLLQQLTRDEDAALKMNYRRDKTFRWPYLDDFEQYVWGDRLTREGQGAE